MGYLQGISPAQAQLSRQTLVSAKTAIRIANMINTIPRKMDVGPPALWASVAAASCALMFGYGVEYKWCTLRSFNHPPYSN